MRKRGIGLLAAVMAGMLLCLPAEKVYAAEPEGRDIASLLEGIKDDVQKALEGMDESEARELFRFVEEKLQDGSLKDEDGIKEAIEEGEGKFDVTVSPQEAQKIVDTMERLEDIGFSGEEILKDAEKLYDQYGAEFLDHSEEIVKEAVKDAAGNIVKTFFVNLWEAIRGFFVSLFQKIWDIFAYTK